MADEKEEKIMDLYTKSSTHDLLSIINEYNSDTKESVKKIKKIEKEQKNFYKKLGKIESKYFDTLRKKEDADIELDINKRKEESTELLYKLILAHIPKYLGKNSIKDFKENPEMMGEYIKMIHPELDFDTIRNYMVENYENFADPDNHQSMYNQFKQILSDNVSKEKRHIDKVKSSLIKDVSHHKTLREETNKMYNSLGYTIDETIKINDVLRHYENNKKGSVNSEYLTKYEHHLKPYNKN
jgi:hypothetical protein